MSSKTQYYLDNSPVEPPMNAPDLTIELNFDPDKESPGQQLSVNDWEFTNENSLFIKQWIEDGKSFVGIPLRIEIEKGSIQVPFDGYIDLTDNPSISCERSIVKAKERQKIDWLNDRADSFSFEYLAHTNYPLQPDFVLAAQISPSDYIFMPYIINSVPDYKEAAVALLSVYVVGEQIKAAINQITALAAEMLNPFEATAIIRAVLYIAYLTILIIAIIKLIKDIINLLIQPVKYHAGMKVKTLLQKGAAHLGLTFKSDILDTGIFEGAFIIPEKNHNPVNKIDSKILGFTSPSLDQNGYYKGTYGDLLRGIKKAFKGKFIVTDSKELIFLRKDKSTSASLFTIPDVEVPFFTTNAHEMPSNYYLSFETDLSDKNTIQEYEGTAYQVVTYVDGLTTNKDLALTKGVVQENIPFALAKIKNDLTIPEQILKDFIDAFGAVANGLIKGVNEVIKVYNKIVKKINKLINALDNIGIKINFEIKSIPALQPFAINNLIQNRLGMMKLESDSFSRPKIMLITEGSGAPKFNKLSSDNSVFMSAEYLYNQFHYVDSFIPSSDRPNGNQCYIKSYEGIHFCYEDYVKVKTNNKALTAAGEEAEIVSLKWNVYDQQADLQVRISKLYATNLKQQTIEPDGQ